MAPEKVDCVVIGAGVVGLAVARELSRQGREVVLLEQSDAIGTGISSRNSEVIHAGIYYPSDSLKARFCVVGNSMLYHYCREYRIAHRRCGKLIVATTAEQIEMLKEIQQRALMNKVTDLCWLTPADVQQIEPALRCSAALLSPSTGIVDTHGFMLSLLGDAECHGAMLALEAKVTGMTPADGRIRIRVDGDEPMTLEALSVINAAGFGALELARSCSANPARQVPLQVLAKGNYFGLTGKSPVSRLIYPVPEPGGLGVHITLDLNGRVRFGPDVEWIDDFDYAVDPARADNFYAAVRRYWPDLEDGALVPDYAGIRPKLSLHGSIYPDFMINGPQNHGVNGLVNLLGIESPGLTSSLAIAAAVAALL